MRKNMKPESLMMSYGYRPSLSEGAVKCPIFQTSTFVFDKAEEGKAFFEVAYGLRTPETGEEQGLIYSRLNNPDLEILENRLALWDSAEDCAVFESGMSAITTAFLTFLKPGDLLLYSNPVYGGTDHFIKEMLTKFGIEILPFDSSFDKKAMIEAIEATGKAKRLKMIYLETPANPTNALIDISMCQEVKKHFETEENEILISVDNTYLGPIWQHPLEHGADLVLYSATKYIGGHSDVIAGACLGSSDHMAAIKGTRTFLGNMAGPWTGWLLMRSLETLKLRMEKQQDNAIKVADFFKSHPKIERINYLGHLTEAENPKQYAIYKKQCKGSGAMLSIELKGGEPEAFAFLNNLKLVKLAVSLGSTESLAQHPASMTHAGVPEDDKIKYGIKDNLVRLSVGVEHFEDLINDLQSSLEKV